MDKDKISIPSKKEVKYILLCKEDVINNVEILCDVFWKELAKIDQKTKDDIVDEISDELNELMLAYNLKWSTVALLAVTYIAGEVKRFVEEGDE